MPVPCCLHRAPGVVLAGHRRRSRQASCRDQGIVLGGSCTCYSEGPPGRPVVQYRPKVKKVSPAPEEVPVVHSSAYLLKSSKQGKREKTVVSAVDRDSENESKSVMEWALRQADAYFDKVEADEEAHSTARVLVKNPATQVTMKTMQGVTTLGAATAPHLAKAAAPVGKKLLSLSADVLVAGVSAINDAAKKANSNKKGQ